MKKSILITGCSKGFGLLFAEELAKDGHKVYATTRDLANAQSLLNLTNKYRNLHVLKFDVVNSTELDTVHKIIDHEENGKLDVLINNAGYGLMGRVDEVDHSQIQRQFETNTFAPIEISKQFLSLLNQSEKGGLIINISSIASYFGLPGFGVYSSSKAALNTLSMSLAIENKNRKLSVVLVEPGPFETSFRESVIRMGEDESYQKARSGLFPSREDPLLVSNLVKGVILEKHKEKLGAFREIPIGKKSNLLRLVSRWLPQEMIVNLMSKKS
ncbi:MAG: SDR family NAD(P)-dependent oxidoreductase [Candidatus Caenarcaniphilales bacterium]|nr:SDR family NAD(P)-dependent oxidoreductase [Candidatus Caenarcaniphilales bacterium]